MNKIKIAHCMVGLDGGVGVVVRNYFDCLDANDYQVDIIESGNSDDPMGSIYKERGYGIYHVIKKRDNFIKHVTSLYRIMKTEKYDIVHCHMTLTNFIPLIVAKLCKVPVRISHSHLAGEDNGLKNKIVHGVYKKLGKMNATHYFACGQEAGKYLFGASDFKVLHNAIDLAKYKFNPKVRAEKRKKLGIKEEFVIGHIGRFTRQKNHTFLLEIFKKVLSEAPSAKLVLAGDGELYNEVKEHISRLNMEKNVIMLGNVDKVEHILQTFDMFVLPSLFEGLPLVLLEAQASGTACIASDNVAGEAKVNENVKFLSRTLSAGEWCKEILSTDIRKDNINLELFQKKNLDIVTEAENLDLFYKSNVFGRKGRSSI